uniref:THAP-type domain-containing protein n=1 Tax=Nomascus leucogenys TaxID=61853 RepID=A0A2I3HHV0_NOMLE
APNLCAAKSSQSDLAFFRFPRDPEWVENCRRADVEDKTADRLGAVAHTSMICRTSPYRTVLRDKAIPTIFDLTTKSGLKQKNIDETSEQEQKHKETNNSNAQNPSEEEGEGQDEDILPLSLEEKENKEYLKSLFAFLIQMGKQNIPLDGQEAEEIPEGLFALDNFQALLECQINSGEEVLRKRFKTTLVNTLFSSKTQRRQMVEICESYIRDETLREERKSHFFSIITDYVVDIAGEEFVDESYSLREEFIGFLPYEANAEILAVKFHTMITEKWGLNMEYCYGQAYIVSSGFSSKMKVVASRLVEKYPQAIYTLRTSCALNMWLAKSVPVMGVSVALGTIEEVCSFFPRSPQLLLELDNVTSVLFQNSKERGEELKEICHSQWTGRHDAFEILVELLQALVLGLDGINNDTNIRWNNCIAGRAFVLCSSVTDFDFIVTIVVLKNVLSFTRAFGKNLQGQTSDVLFAAGSLTVLHLLKEVMENIEVYHEFWFEEATNLVTKLDIQMKLPGKFHSAHQGNLESQLASESYYKDTLSVPTVEHIIQEVKDIFLEQHLKALKCLSLVPSVMGQLKFNMSEEHHADMYRSDLPNPDTLSAKLHCWRIKWKHGGNDIELPSTIYEAPHLPDIKFFPNVYALLKVLCFLPVMKRLKAYLRNTLTDQSSSNLALLNMNCDIKHNLDLMMDTYIKLYTSKSELPTDNSETIENT